MCKLNSNSYPGLGIRKKNLLRKSLIFWQLPLSYILLILVPLVMSMLIVIFVYNNLMEQSKKSNTYKLENTMRTIENSLTVIDELSPLIGSNSRVIHFVGKSNFSNKGELTGSIIGVLKELTSLKDSNNLIGGYFIYSLANDSIISPGQGIVNLEKYYGSYLDCPNMKYSEFRELLNKKHYRKYLHPRHFQYGSYNSQTILYMDSLINNEGKTVGNVVAYINAEKIQELILQATKEDPGDMYIFGKEGDLFISTLDIGEVDKLRQSGTLYPTGYLRQVINDPKNFVSYRISDGIGWIYLISIPFKNLFRQIRNIMGTIISNLIILYGIMIAITYFSLKLTRSPLVNMVKNLPTTMVSTEKIMRKGVNYVNTVVTKIILEKQLLEDRVKEQKNLLSCIALSKLESGEIKNETDLNQLMSNLEISCKGKSYRGGYLIIKDPEADIVLPNYQMILKVISAYEEYVPAVSYKGKHLFALLYQQNIEEDKIYKKIFQTIYHALLNQFKMESIIYIGPPCNDLIGVYKSFDVARYQLNPNTITLSEHKFLIECQSYNNNVNLYIYPAWIEEKLTNFINLCNKEGISDLLWETYKKNFVKNCINGYMQNILFAKILGTLMEFEKYFTVMPELAGSLRNMDPKHFFSLVEEQCFQICTTLQCSNERSHKENLKKILDYINDNIYNYDLTLYQLASVFNMHESYLSTCIKDYTGKNFTSYVEELRMQKANSLLEMGTYTVTVISEMVGYSNPHSFRRAYKRLYGYTPTAYKNLKDMRI